MSRQLTHVFDEYQRARTQFVQTVAEMSTRPQHIEALQSMGVLALLRPLLLDTVPAVQQTAALALSRLAGHNEELAGQVAAGDILPQLVRSLADQNRFYKKAAGLVIKAVAKHSPALAEAVVAAGATQALAGCLEEFDPGVKEAASLALGHIARHNEGLAQAVVDSGAVPHLALCVQEPELPVKRAAVGCLADIAKHSLELAQAVANAGTIDHVAPLILSPDTKLKRNVCLCLGAMARNSVDLAELAVEAEIFPKILLLLRDPDDVVQRNACTAVREVAKHTPELAQLIVNAGGVGALVDYVASTRGPARLPGIMTLGYIAAFSEALALAVVEGKGIPPLAHALEVEEEDHIKAAAAWSLGQVGRHSSEHARSVAAAHVFPRLLAAYVSSISSDDLKAKAKRALKSVVQKCVDLPALQPLLQASTPLKVLKHVCGQYAKILPRDVAARREFVANQGFATLQKISPQPGSKLAGYIQTINNCYPPEIVQYYSPNFTTSVLDRIEAYPTK